MKQKALTATDILRQREHENRIATKKFTESTFTKEIRLALSEAVKEAIKKLEQE